MKRLAFLPLALAIACTSAEKPPPEVDPETRRELTSGAVVGFSSEDGAHVWRGIPFARPPVGELRWRAPRPPEPWQGVREATRFGSQCVQFAGFGRGQEGQPIGDEDCLVLNVFAPPFVPAEVPRGDDRLPVMVWIHGGGNTVGSADIYESSRLALGQDVVVVSVNYRLGVFGWFRHPALHGGGDTDADRSGNYGTLDLVRALKWVRDNASVFGGDPGNVTVFGESSGGVNVYTLLLSPRARGLFHRGISQSGLLMSSSLADAENFTDADEAGHPRSSREVLLSLLLARGASDREAAKTRLAGMSGPEAAALLRSAPAREILLTFDGARFGPMYDAPLVFPDGDVLPALDPLRALADGHYNQVPVILGTNRDESKLFALFTSDDVTRLFGVPLWLDDARRYDVLSEYGSRMWKASGVDEPARAMRQVQGPSVFAYRFDWDEQPSLLWADFSDLLGAAHAIEIPFVLGHLDLGFWNRVLFDEQRRPAAQRLSDAMMSYWGAFAHAGTPGRGRDGSLPPWTPWNANGGKYIVLDTEAGGGIRMSSETVDRDVLIGAVERDDRLQSLAERCEVYAGFVLWSRRMTEEEYSGIADGACREFPLQRI